MENELGVLADLLNVIEQAIEDKDWVVDGACDPDFAMQRAKHILVMNGFYRNSIDGEWQR